MCWTYTSPAPKFDFTFFPWLSNFKILLKLLLKKHKVIGDLSSRCMSDAVTHSTGSSNLLSFFNIMVLITSCLYGCWVKWGVCIPPPPKFIFWKTELQVFRGSFLGKNGRNSTVTFSPLVHSGCVCCSHHAYVFDMCLMLSEQWSREQGFHFIIPVSHHPFVLEILFPYVPPCPQEESVSTPCKV